MNTNKCQLCGMENPIGESNCGQCGSTVFYDSNKPPTSAEDQLRKLNEINEEIRKLSAKMIPARTSSFNGCGTMLLDYRPIGDGHYEASRWITIFAFPIVPLSVWKIRPHEYSMDGRTERQTFELLGKRRLDPWRVVRPFAVLAGGALPFVLAYYFLDLGRVVKIISRSLGTGIAVAMIFVLIILVLVWFGFIMTRIHNTKSAYKS